MAEFDTAWATTPGYLEEVIPAYPYVQYNDDDDIRAFFDAYNQLAQEIITWLTTANLPIYTTAPVSGSLLDWVALGLYGEARPVLPASAPRTIGPLNTWAPNTVTPNSITNIPPTDFYATTDDIFRRCLTWNLFKGDGRTFSVRWLKRRVMRFLSGTDGAPINPDNTYQISVTFGIGNAVTIRLVSGLRNVTGGAFPNGFMPNTMMPNGIATTWTQYAPLEYGNIFKAAVQAGVLQLPFQYEWTVVLV